MEVNNNIQAIKESQLLQKKWTEEMFEDYETLIANNTPEEAEDFIISLYEEEVYDCVEVKIDTDAQTGFFTIAQSVTPIKHFWHFLENIVIGAEKSYQEQDQEGPEASFVVSKVNDDKIRVTLISDGWWEFYKNRRGLHKVSYDNPQVPLDMVCSAKEFIIKMYATLKKIKYPKEYNYDPWKGAPRDSKILKKYAEQNR